MYRTFLNLKKRFFTIVLNSFFIIKYIQMGTEMIQTEL